MPPTTAQRQVWTEFHRNESLNQPVRFLSDCPPSPQYICSFRLLSYAPRRPLSILSLHGVHIRAWGAQYIVACFHFTYNLSIKHSWRHALFLPLLYTWLPVQTVLAKCNRSIARIDESLRYHQIKYFHGTEQPSIYKDISSRWKRGRTSRGRTSLHTISFFDMVRGTIGDGTRKHTCKERRFTDASSSATPQSAHSCPPSSGKTREWGCCSAEGVGTSTPRLKNFLFHLCSRALAGLCCNVQD